jgi:hypothetical protein
MTLGAHRAFIENAARVLEDDGRVVGLAPGGSRAGGDGDEYADLYLVVAVRPDALLAVLKDRATIAEKLGKLLSSFPGEHIGLPGRLICLYDHPLLHVELDFATSAEAPSMIQGYEDQFWIWVHHAAARIGGGRLLEAMDKIAYLRSSILGPMIAGSTAFGGERYVERYAPEFVPRLLKTVPVHDACSCIRSLRAAIELYRELRESYRDGIILRDEAEMRSIEYLDEMTDLFLDRVDCDNG